eukprot:TRINITY_DN21234_c0_g1_i1.p1 TRINITY_DN21234_c0_g1~~TRINITY_DN21234_c0_g1_i1.p1  ORF type:complete len:764 (-),score=59.95 TRINITY_DN21234_c0_g1_i1:116-2407(-)
MAQPIVLALALHLHLMLGYASKFVHGEEAHVHVAVDQDSIDNYSASHGQTSTSRTSKVRVAYVIRSYHGDAYFLRRLLQNLRMFAPPEYPRIVVLDNESVEDHSLGVALEKEFEVSVKFESLPNFPLAPSDQGLQRARTVGYQRQMWSSFWLDKYTDADVIAQLDSDAQIVTLISPDTFFDKSGKLFLRALLQDHWQGDRLIDHDVRTRLGKIVPDIDAMWLDHMPMFFWRNTFSNFRKTITRAMAANSFDEAFRSFMSSRYSWQNMLYQYALAFESQSYVLRNPTNPAQLVLSIGTNKPIDVRRMQAGCCRSFKLTKTEGCTSEMLQDSSHVLSFNNVPAPLTAESDRGGGGMASQHYMQAWEFLQDSLSVRAVTEMRGHCLAFMQRPTVYDWKPRLGFIAKLAPKIPKQQSPFASAISDATSGRAFRMVKRRLFNGSAPDYTGARARFHAAANTRDAFCTSQDWAVVTTIFSATEAIRKLDSAGWCTVVVADKKSVQSLAKYYAGSKHVTYLTPEDQIKMKFASVRFMPWNSFSRKNLGYLYAMQEGARSILDIDDDNEVDLSHNMGPLVKGHGATTTVRLLHGRAGAVNPYDYFQPEAFTWPRGLPLNTIMSDNINMSADSTLTTIDLNTVAVRQHLAQMNPDVDAIFRLTRHLPVSFSQVPLPLVLSSGAWSPFNAQATTWTQAAFPLMFLPMSVNGRVSDIWRSYIAQPLLWQLNLTLCFTGPRVSVPRRNVHDLSGDFVAEMPLYEQASALMEFLEG